MRKITCEQIISVIYKFFLCMINTLPCSASRSVHLLTIQRSQRSLQRPWITAQKPLGWQRCDFMFVTKYYMLGVLCSKNSIKYEMWPLVICDVMHSERSGNLVELLTRQFKHRLFYSQTAYVLNLQIYFTE